MTPSSPTRSPGRKVVSDFGSFAAPANTSVFATAVQSSPFSLAGGRAAFGGMRATKTTNSFGDDSDDEKDDKDEGSGTIGGRQKIELREDSITLDQVSLIKSRFFVCSLRTLK